MGWLALFTLDPLFAALTMKGMAWMLGGGLVYTVGIVFYLLDEQVPWFHGIWHLFVLGGSICHYVAILLLVG
jgi:hemolysin III